MSVSRLILFVIGVLGIVPRTDADDVARFASMTAEERRHTNSP